MSQYISFIVIQLPVCLSVCLCLSIAVSTCLSVSLYISLSVCASDCLSVYLFVCLCSFMYLFILPSVNLSVCLSVSLFIYLHVCVFNYLFVTSCLLSIYHVSLIFICISVQSYLSLTISVCLSICLCLYLQSICLAQSSSTSLNCLYLSLSVYLSVTQNPDIVNIFLAFVAVPRWSLISSTVSHQVNHHHSCASELHLTAVFLICMLICIYHPSGPIRSLISIWGRRWPTIARLRISSSEDRLFSLFVHISLWRKSFLIIPKNFHKFLSNFRLVRKKNSKCINPVEKNCSHS